MSDILSYLVSHSRSRRPVEHKEDFLLLLSESCKQLVKDGIYYSPGASRYKDFSQQILAAMNAWGDMRIGQPERAGITVSLSAIEGMAAAVSTQGLGIDDIRIAMTNRATTATLKDLTDKGTTPAQREVGDYESSRVARIESIVGLRDGRFEAPLEPRSRLLAAFKYQPEGGEDGLAYFSLSDATQHAVDRVGKIGEGREAICPMRSKVEQVFCVLAETACAIDSLVPRDIGVPGTSGLILP